jgi:hypothetical protein
MDQFINIAAIAGAIALAIALVGAGVWFLLSIFLHWPTRISIKSTPTQSFAILFALLCSPVVWQWGVKFGGDVVHQAVSMSSEISRNAVACASNCGPTLSTAFSKSASAAIAEIGTTLTAIPLGHYVVFLLLILLVDRLSILAVVDGPRGSSTSNLNRFLRSRALIIGTFLAIIAFAFYLCLTALLAIPLIERQAVPEGYSAQDLKAELDEIILPQKTFDERFPILESVPKAEDLVSEWNGLRTGSYEAMDRNRLQGVAVYRSESEDGLGGRESIKHYAAILRWFGDERRNVESNLDRCLGSMRTLLRILKEPATQVDATLNAAAVACGTLRQRLPEKIPTRDDVSDPSVTADDWAEWLVKPRSMPLIIIIGLVGFSFLGAGLAHVVKAGNPARAANGWLSIPDLVVFIISGAAASLTVFAASYGGLAVLGDVPANPNAYVVFTLCFAAALFSDVVWSWLREILARFTGDNKDDGEHDNEGEDGDADAKKDKETTEANADTKKDEGSDDVPEIKTDEAPVADAPEAAAPVVPEQPKAPSENAEAKRESGRDKKAPATKDKPKPPE